MESGATIGHISNVCVHTKLYTDPMCTTDPMGTTYMQATCTLHFCFYVHRLCAQVWPVSENLSSHTHSDCISAYIVQCDKQSSGE